MTNGTIVINTYNDKTIGAQIKYGDIFYSSKENNNLCLVPDDMCRGYTEMLIKNNNYEQELKMGKCVGSVINGGRYCLGNGHIFVSKFDDIEKLKKDIYKKLKVVADKIYKYDTTLVEIN
jgi:hypothetical protein